MNNKTLTNLHSWLTEVFSQGNSIDKADALDMLGALEQQDKRSFWIYLGENDNNLRDQMKAVRT